MSAPEDLPAPLAVHVSQAVNDAFYMYPSNHLEEDENFMIHMLKQAHGSAEEELNTIGGPATDDVIKLRSGRKLLSLDTYKQPQNAKRRRELQDEIDFFLSEGRSCCYNPGRGYEDEL